MVGETRGGRLSRRSGRRGRAMTTAGRSRIVVVDDNLTNLKLVTFLLAQGPYDVRAAVDGEDALDLARTFKPRLILLDLQVPDIDVPELTRRLRADPTTRDTLLVAVTTEAPPDGASDARAGGAYGLDGYITKPLQPDRFRHAVASYLTE